MKRLAPDIVQISSLLPNAINAYLVGPVLIDAGTRQGTRKLLRVLQGRQVSVHALTHAHPDHQGASHAVCEAMNLPLVCGAADADAVEQPDQMLAGLPQRGFSAILSRRWAGPGHPVARRLREGDEVEGFSVIETPGHTAGHVS